MAKNRIKINHQHTADEAGFDENIRSDEMLMHDITERNRIEEALIESEQLYRATFDQAAVGIIHTDLDGKLLRVNRKFCDIVGYTEEELIGMYFQDITYHEDREIHLNFQKQMLSNKLQTFSVEKRYVHKNGSLVWVSLTVSIVRKPSGEHKHYITIVEDITERKNSGKELEFKSFLLDNVADSVFVHNIDGSIIYVNEAAYRDIGYTKQEMFSMTPYMLDIAKDDGVIETRLDAVLKNGSARFEVNHLRKDGTIMPAEVHAQLVEFNGKEVLVGILRDMTERKRAEEMLNYMAYYDTLTGLPNRSLLNDRLMLALANAHRNNDMLAILFLDLDNFKTINDTLGHVIGDKLLQNVADRLSGCLREGDTIARLGGDEFVLLLPKINVVEDAVKVAQKVIEVLMPPFVFDSRELHVTTSIGITLYPNDGDDAQTLLKNADAALYRAKDFGRNNYQLYTPSMNAKAFERLALESSIRKALEKEEFVLYYQPMVDIRSGEITGMEALLRWQHPELGLVLPMEFIPQAEETGLIMPIGEWVLKTACRQNKKWQDEGCPPIRIAVNLSAKQFQQQDLVEMVEGVLKESALDPKYLELEITESVIMKDANQAAKTLRKLKEAGTKISIDDFGTGYSSLNYLKSFPIDTLKIDRSFICDVTTDAGDAAITMAIISLARSLNLKVIAEGVESNTQLKFLRSLKCDEIQGYIFSRPVPQEETLDLLRKETRLCA